MSMNNDVVQQIMDRINIVDFINRYVDVKKVGKNYMAVCPFHDDKGPSLSISEDKGLFHCFGCGASGNVINFLMQYDNVEFKEALKRLAKEANIELKYDKKKKSKFDRFYEINSLAAEYYHNNLVNSTAGKKALSYLKKRGINKKIIKKFKLGFAFDDWHGLYNYLKRNKIKFKNMQKLSIVRQSNDRKYDFLRNRVIFPIFDRKNDVIGFGGRILKKDEKQPKYLNIGETPLFKKSGVLYGFNATKRNIYRDKELILVEGYMDFLTMYQYGIENCAAILGTAFTKKHREIVENRINDIYLFFDSDQAGRKATIRSLEIIFDSSISPYVIENNTSKDPDELLRENGEELFYELKEDAEDGFSFYMNYKTKNIDMDNPNQKVRVYKNIKNKLYDISDKDLRHAYLKKLADYFGFDYNKYYKAGYKKVRPRKFYPRNEVLLVMFILEKKEFAEKIFDLKSKLGVYVTDENILNQIRKLYKLYHNGKELFVKGNVSIFINDDKLKKQIFEYTIANKFELNKKNLNSLIGEINRIAKIKQNKEV
ncbi:MAG: DNA primase [Candidatus Mcinerneyibacterium aminivorans]|uniref:DNA primase n=1 Tax=Candidatus Mcinerneyibacterium aminivorans TaxID=2703815 RepID=A0A5D0MFI4_9BACT|nr:MAG: DNA primase [Candidatus Mcinerneyibacterium aminivorans]